ncbi:MAG: DUF1540 domain-containing protein [Ruminococcaceae bacterium]|nr:DUF1540 domain-containing protein [Oscillospiraceae bacterium]
MNNQPNSLPQQSAAGKKIKHIKGVCCNVKSCAFHDGESCCTAKAISIGPTQATSCADTVCATFKQQS